MIDEIYDLLSEVDKEFEPALSQRVDLLDYARKLVEKSVIIPVFIQNKLASFISFYANNETTKVSYITMVVVKREFRGKGFGNDMVDYALNLSKNLRMQYVHLEVDKANYPALKLYKEKGFIILSEEDYSYKMQINL